MQAILLCLFIFLFGSQKCSESFRYQSEPNILILIKSWIRERQPNNIDLSSIVFPCIKISEAVNVSEDDKIIDKQKSNNTISTENNQSIYSIPLSTAKNNTNNKNHDNDQNISYNFHEEPVNYSKTVTCSEKDERYPILDKCDSYIECQNGIAEEKQCPDGLRYNHNSKSDSTPCLYPADIECNEGATLQTPKSTEDCPNQFGYYKTEDQYNCSSYRICENGTGYDYNCPDGLAFNIKHYRCDWPDKVPQCNAEAYLGFRCPDITQKQDVSKGYRSLTDCKTYFVCINGRPRRLECNNFFGFDQLTQKCVPANELENCTRLQQSAARLAVRRRLDGEYVIQYSDNYIDDRSTDIRFISRIRSKPKIIL